MFYELSEKHFHELFFLLFSSLKDCALLLLQSSPGRELEAQMLLLRLGAVDILRGMGHGKIVGSNFFTSYDALSNEWEHFYSSAKIQRAAYSFPEFPIKATISSRQKMFLRQKIQRFLQKRQISPLVSLLKKGTFLSGSFWQTIFLFFQVICRFDRSICLSELFKLCEHDPSWKGLSKWLDCYYNAHPVFPVYDHVTHPLIQMAIILLHQNYSKDLTLENIAETIGLTAPYFSNLFKKQVGKNFVTMLHEIRIRHAITLMEMGEQDMEKLASQCGYYNKKYFFEKFKQITGQSVTQYRLKKA